MKTKNIIWLFSEFLNGSKLIDPFCKENGFMSRTTGDWEYFGDIVKESEHIAALLIDADQFSIEDTQAILEKIKLLIKPGLFKGKIFFLSKKPDKYKEIRHLHRVCLAPNSRQIYQKLRSSLIH